MRKKCTKLSLHFVKISNRMNLVTTVEWTQGIYTVPVCQPVHSNAYVPAQLSSLHSLVFEKPDNVLIGHSLLKLFCKFTWGRNNLCHLLGISADARVKNSCISLMKQKRLVALGRLWFLVASPKRPFINILQKVFEVSGNLKKKTHVPYVFVEKLHQMQNAPKNIKFDLFVDGFIHEYR